MNNNEVWIAGGFNGNEYLSSIEIFKDGKWTKSSVELPGKVYQHCIVKIDENRVLLTGGRFEFELKGILKSVFLFENNRWEKKQNMKEARIEHSCAVLEGKKVIVSGGFNGDNYLSSSEIYDPATNTWTEGPELPSATVGAKMINVGGDVYHVGGSETRKDIFRLEKLDSSTWKFKKVGSLSEEKYYLDVLPIKISPEDCNGWQ